MLPWWAVRGEFFIFRSPDRWKMHFQNLFRLQKHHWDIYGSPISKSPNNVLIYTNTHMKKYFPGKIEF